MVGELLWLESPDHDEARRMGPPNGLIAEFGHLDALAGHTDNTTKMMGEIKKGDRIEAKVNDQNHALSIRSVK
ncbi:MAG: hypothetical protein SGJ26_16655 [Nitrospirota bacterium]|nr:hypothetical protein [Nitrospirota bacterium]